MAGRTARRISSLRQAFVMPLALLAVVAVGFFATILYTLGSGSRTYLRHVAREQVCFQIAQGSVSQVLADLQRTGWAGRAFAGRPLRRFSVQLLDGEYDQHVEDSPGHAFEFDVYVRSRFSGMTRMYFWRVGYRDDILDISNRFTPKVFLEPPPERFPPAGGGGSFAATVDDLLGRRARNRPEANRVAAQVIGLDDVVSIAQILGADHQNATSTSEFASPAGGGRRPARPDQIAGLPPIPFPHPQSASFNDDPETSLPVAPPAVGGNPDPGGTPPPSAEPPPPAPPAGGPPAVTPKEPNKGIKNVDPTAIRPTPARDTARQPPPPYDPAPQVGAANAAASRAEAAQSAVRQVLFEMINQDTRYARVNNSAALDGSLIGEAQALKAAYWETAQAAQDAARAAAAAATKAEEAGLVADSVGSRGAAASLGNAVREAEAQAARAEAELAKAQQILAQYTALMDRLIAQYLARQRADNAATGSGAGDRNIDP